MERIDPWSAAEVAIAMKQNQLDRALKENGKYADLFKRVTDRFDIGLPVTADWFEKTLQEVHGVDVARPVV